MDSQLNRLQLKAAIKSHRQMIWQICSRSTINEEYLAALWQDLINLETQYKKVSSV